MWLSLNVPHFREKQREKNKKVEEDRAAAKELEDKLA